MPPFEIKVDRFSGRISVVLRGFWSPEVFTAYVTQIMQIESELQALGRRIEYLCDASEFQVQTREMAERFLFFVSQSGPHVRKVAAIVPHALLRMQGERVLRDDRQRLFADEAAALAWLAEDEAGRGCAAA